MGHYQSTEIPDSPLRDFFAFPKDTIHTGLVCLFTFCSFVVVAVERRSQTTMTTTLTVTIHKMTRQMHWGIVTTLVALLIGSMLSVSLPPFLDLRGHHYTTSRNERLLQTTTSESSDAPTPTLLTKNNRPSFHEPILQENGTMLVSRLNEIHPCDYFVPRKLPNGTTLLRTFDPPDSPIHRIHFHFDDCSEHQLGNRLGEHYLRYLLANALQIPYQMSCGDPSDDNPYQNLRPQQQQQQHNPKQESVLKHLQNTISPSWTIPGPVPHGLGGTVEPDTVWSPAKVCNACRGAGWHCPEGIHTLHHSMVQDMQWLAHHTDTAHRIQHDHDDAVIHVRLGDVFRGQNDQKIGLLPHGAYSDLLSQNEQQQDDTGPLQSIGIVTQAFEKQHVRSFDKNARLLHRSQLVALDLQRHLQTLFPSAIVRIHNGPDETPLHSMVRLIQAKRIAICGPSTFCTLPTLATNGKGYFFRGEKHSPWVHRLVRRFPERLESFTAPRLANNYTTVLSDEEILMWVRNQPTRMNDAISSPPLLRT